MNLQLDSKPLKVRKGISLLQGRLPGNETIGIGIDPGVRFGLATIVREYVQVYYGNLGTDRRPGYRGIIAYDFVMNSSLTEYKIKPGIVTPPVAIVEGAAYNDKYGQVTLEEVRFGFFFSLYNLGMDVRIIPPASVRKGALGSGKLSVGDLYPNVNHNACDAIGCALYAVNVAKGEI